MKTMAQPTVKKFLTRDTDETNAKRPLQKAVIDVTFVLDHPDSKDVFLSGDFNSWAPQTIRMARRGGSGRWEKHLTLPPGRYEYKFVVDDEWVCDPHASAQVPNNFGSCNSVVEAKP